MLNTISFEGGEKLCCVGCIEAGISFVINPPSPGITIHSYSNKRLLMYFAIFTRFYSLFAEFISKMLR